MSDFIMSPQQKEKLEERRRQLYLAVRNRRPDLYERAVQIGHLATPEFGGHDPVKRAATVETSVMNLINDILGESE